MKEININIEGYNVNGICVGCLNYNRKMFYSKEIQECFKNLAEIDVPDGLSIQVCWECLASVHTVNRFRQQILYAYDVLIDYSKKHTFLNSPADLTQYSNERLSSVMVGCFDNLPLDQNLDQKDESSIKVETEEVPVDFNAEQLVTKVETDYNEDTISEGIPDHMVTSDDDIQLSLLKKEKTVRKKKREKKLIKRAKEFRKSSDVSYNEQSEGDGDFSPTDGSDYISDSSDKSQYARKTSTPSAHIIVPGTPDTSFEEQRTKEVKEEQQPRGTRILKNLPENLVEVYTMSEEEMFAVRSEDLSSKEFSRLKYKCQDCIIGFNTEKLMKDHMSGRHIPKSTNCKQCDICKVYLLTKDKLSVHKSLHLSALRCVQCGLTTTMKRVMMKHVRVHGTEGFQCNSCEKFFSSKSKLSYHKNVCHQEKPQCDCCGKVFANKMTLKYHLKILPQNKVDKPKEKLYIPCKGCNKVFHSKKSYRAHVVIHDGLSYPCPVCGKLFQWKRNLARHTRNHREREAGAIHECRECNKSFSSRDCYNNHMRLSKRHVPEDALGHECNYCGKKFATKWCMVDHIDWDHLKRIKYQCSVCFKPFKTAKIMVAHMNNIHDGKKNREPEGEHLCEVCGKSYKTVKRLKGHVWAMHTNRSTTKSFKCKLCPATFTWQTSIYKHTKMMHSNTKRGKQPNRLPTMKKLDPYPEVEGSRMHYFEMNEIAHISQQHIGIVPSLP